LKNNQKNYQREKEILNNRWSNKNLIPIVEQEIGHIFRNDKDYMKRYYKKRNQNFFTKDRSDYILTFFAFMLVLAIWLIVFYFQIRDPRYSLQKNWYYKIYFIYILIKPVILDFNRIRNGVKVDVPGLIYLYYCLQLFFLYLYYQLLDNMAVNTVHIVPKIEFFQQISENKALMWFLIDLIFTVAVFIIKDLMNLEMFEHQSKSYKYLINYIFIPTIATMLTLFLIVVWSILF